MSFLKQTINWLTFNKFQKQNFTKDSLKRDLYAGIIVGLILIPQSLAYAQLAGLPPVYGLYASIFPVVVAVLFGSSNYLSTGPVAVLSILTATTVSPLADPGTPAYITYVIVLALMSGLLQVGLGLLRAGWLVNFLSHPVVYGFTNAAAIIIASTQIGAFFGITLPRESHFYETIWNAIKIIPAQADWNTVILGLASLSLIWAFKYISPKIPGALIALLAGTFVCWWFSIDVATVGTIANPIPSLTVPEFHLYYLYDLFFGLALITLIGFTESIAIAQTIATKTKEKIDPDRELIGQGLANITSAFSGGYPVAGSLSRTVINFSNRARSWMAGLFCAGTVLLTVGFFINFLKYTPQVLLAVVIIIGITSIINPKKIRTIFKVNFYDGLAALITFFGTLVFAPDMEKGILLGLAFSIGYFLYRNTHPRVVFLSRHKDGFLRDASVYGLKQCKNIAVIRLDGALFFANARFFENHVIEYLAKHSSTKHIIFVAGAISDIDATGAEIFYELVQNLKQADKEVYMANIKYPAEAMFKRTNIWALIAQDHFLPTTQVAVKEVIKIANHNKDHKDQAQCPLEQYLGSHHMSHAKLLSNAGIKKLAKKLMFTPLKKM